jgi:hypothetical protein
MLSLRRCLFLCVSLLLFTASASALCPNYLSSTLWSGVDSAEADGQYLYMSLMNGLVVLDYTDGDTPVEVGRLTIPGRMGQLKLANGVAYLLAYETGLYIIDISDPAEPEILSLYENDSATWGYDITSRYAYLPVDHSSQIQIVDITDPYAPFLFVHHDMGHTLYDIKVHGGHVYTVGSEEGLRIYLMDGAADPVEIGTYRGLNNVGQLTFKDDTVFLLDYSGGEKKDRGDTRLVAVDVSTPEKPSLISHYDEFGDAWNMFIDGDYAYLSDVSEYEGIVILDISDPALPVHVGVISGLDWPQRIVIQGGTLFVTQSSRGLTAIDVTNPYAPDQLWSWQEGGLATDVWVNGDYAYVADRSEGLWVVDVSDIMAPRPIKEFYAAGVPTALTFQDDYLYLSAAEGGLHIFDTTIPSDPVLVHTIGRATKELVVAGPIGYAASDESDLVIYDLHDPTMPVLLSHLPLPRDADGLDVSGNIACVCTPIEGLQFIDVSDPANPVVLGSYDPNALFYHVAIFDHYAVAPSSSDGVYIVDFSDPAYPVLAAHVEVSGNLHAAEMVGEMAYITRRYQGGFSILDLTDPTDPRVVCECTTDGSAMHTFVQDELVFLADNYSLTILIDEVAAVDDPSLPLQSGPRLQYPNPVFGDTRIHLGNLATRSCRVELLDVAGRLTRTLYNDRLDRTNLELNWHLGTEPSGTYYLRVVTDRYQVTKPVILIR